ncbi:MAG: trypsin-like serine protease [Rhodopila sp.]|nr:trypsin-like serine protease [Rhodopila sp.]
MSSNPDVYPYDTIAYITDTIGGQTWQGSGVLISPDEVLTASHVVYSSTYGPASNISVSFGYSSGTVGIGSASAVSVHYNTIQDPGDIITAAQSQIDYAVIHLSQPFTGIGTMGLEANFPGGPVDVSGYPAASGGQLDISQQYVTLQLAYTLFDGSSIGPGSSGGPVWITGSNGQPYVVGLVSSAAGGVGSVGFFTAITTSAFNQIEAWVAQDDAPSSSGNNNTPLAVVDTSTGQALTPVTTPYTGPVSGLLNQYISITSDSLNITATTPGWFIHSGSGEDAIAVSSGTNVLDGGTGSNFLTGGSGADTFFLDDRQATADVWDTINNFHAGDAATLWGVTQAGFNMSWANNQGATGYLGLTLHVSAAGAPNAALTLVGFSQADLQNGRLSVSFGTDAASGSPYMYVTENR